MCASCTDIEVRKKKVPLGIKDILELRIDSDSIQIER